MASKLGRRASASVWIACYRHVDSLFESLPLWPISVPRGLSATRPQCHAASSPLCLPAPLACPSCLPRLPAPLTALVGRRLVQVLSPQDVFAYEEHLPHCDGVRMIPDAQHAPALENPRFVEQALIAYAKGQELPQGAPMPVRK